jgi:predicted RNA-binding Zn-ribbon protein involved in translation (DUF1610 family)
MNTPATTETFVCSLCYNSFTHAAQPAPSHCPSCGGRTVGRWSASRIVFVGVLLFTFVLPLVASALWLLLKR